MRRTAPRAPARPTAARGPDHGDIEFRPPYDWDLMIGSLIAIWAAGAIFFGLLIVVTHPRESATPPLWVIAGAALVVLLVLILGRHRLPWWTPDACAYMLYAAVAEVIVIDGDPSSPYSIAYLWLAVHAFYFLPWRRAVPQLAVIAGSYAVALAVIDAPFPLLRWSIMALTLVIVCGLVGLLRHNIAVLVGRLADLATTDPLTGLRNRRAYDRAMDAELARSVRSGLPLTLVMADIDHFKAVNDAFGHRTGDEVLQRVARVLDRAHRRTDVAARIGGEEFVILMPATDATEGRAVADRVRAGLEAEFAGDRKRVTMSFGIATHPGHGGDADALLACADAALLAAKVDGRNRAVVYSPLGASPR